MNPEALARHMGLSAGLHRETGALLSLAECLANPTVVVEPSALTAEQKIALVKARWLAGEWSDVVSGTDGLIDLDRALRELEAQSDVGRRLIAIDLRSLEMVHEDADAAQEDR